MISTSWNPETAYQKPEAAGSYDARRFTSRSGRKGDQREKRAFSDLLRRIPEVRSALDVPCGTGRMTEVLLQAGLQVTGCDISEAMMQKAQSRLAGFGEQARFCQGNAKELPFEGASFDLVTCVRLFGHFPSDDRVEMLKEMARVTRRWIIVQYFYETSLTRLKRAVKRRLLRTYPGVVHPLNEQTLRAELAAADLKEHGRAWCRRFYSEEVFLLLEAAGK